MTATAYTRALQRALASEMRRDPRVFVMGEDVQQGVMGPTQGLAHEFGPDRVRNTPISEAAMVGSGIGAAAAGMRPVVDLMIGSFIYGAMDQVVNQAGKLGYMMGGQLQLPLVLLAAHGVSASAAAQHSDCVHPYLMQSGPWTVAAPSTPRDALGLLVAAIRDPNPVALLFHNGLGREQEDLPGDEEIVEPLGRCRVLAEGSDLTIIANGLMAVRALRAREILADRGYSIEVVDPRTWHPLDDQGLCRSARKTHRVLVVEEARRSCSGGSEIVARIAALAWPDLSAAPALIAAPDLPVPFSPVLEREVIPSVERIVSAAEATLAGRPVPMGASPKQATGGRGNQQ
jgi:acetoin:2,6-dichlorophenolindophenol oxidoreductase subunit beta